MVKRFGPGAAVLVYQADVVVRRGMVGVQSQCAFVERQGPFQILESLGLVEKLVDCIAELRVLWFGQETFLAAIDRFCWRLAYLNPVKFVNFGSWPTGVSWQPLRSLVNGVDAGLFHSVPTPRVP